MVMKNYSQLLISLFCALPFLCVAQERSQQDMAAIAREQLLASRAASRSLNGAVGEADVKLLSATDNYQAYTTQGNEGFVVVSRDSRFLPVLGYSSAPFDEASMPPALVWWLENIDRTLALRKAGGQQRAAVSFQPVDNFILTHWGQESPYNDLCPAISWQNALTGCVATALAQVLNYYKYPQASTGETVFSIAGEEGSYAASLNTTYDWNNMVNDYLNIYGQHIASPAEETAVAQLMRDCAYAASMIFDLESSGSDLYSAAIGLTTNLGFDDNYVRVAERDYYSEEEWQTIIYGELAARRPVVYSGADPSSGGHAFVLSGVDNEGRVYVNWGWNGTADGFYELTDMAPTGIQGKAQDHTDHFNTGVNIIYQLTPAPVEAGLPTVPRSQLCAYGVNYSFKPTIANYIELASTPTFDTESDGYVPLINYHYLSFTGTVGLCFINEETQEVRKLTLANLTSVMNYSYYIKMPCMKVNISNVPAGTYTAFLCSTGEDNINVPVRNEGGIYKARIVKAGNGQITITDESTSAIGSVTMLPQVAVRESYNLNGQRIATSRRGLSIERMADGTTRKVIK